MLRWLILGKIICKSSNWQHIQRLKITILGANWQLFRLERIAKCSYFILSVRHKKKIKFYWSVMKINKFLLPIWWYNRGLFPLGNKYLGVFVLNGLNAGNFLWVAQWVTYLPTIYQVYFGLAVGQKVKFTEWIQISSTNIKLFFFFSSDFQDSYKQHNNQ